MKNPTNNALKNGFNFFTHSPYHILILIGLLIGLDQFSKYFVLTYRIFPVYFNENVAFSLPVPWYLPWVMVLLIGIFVLLFSPQSAKYVAQIKTSLSENRLNSNAIVFMIAGGVSNLIDRMVYEGRVVDFIDLKWWPVFNFADSFIVCGLLLFLFSSYITSNIHSKQ